jgi:Domain of unknown function (DUF1844)
MSEERKDPGFTVVDRRASAGTAEEPPPHAEREAPGFDFSVFVQSIAITALHHLGIVAAPGTEGRGERNLPLARQNIEILELLESKTQGNLDAEEAHLLSSLLYEVRMHYVEASKGGR